MTHDRNYWRTRTTTQLVEAARDSGHELAIALGEALAHMEEHCEGEMTREAMALSADLGRAERLVASLTLKNDRLTARLHEEVAA